MSEDNNVIHSDYVEPIRTFADLDDRAETPRVRIKHLIREVAAEHGIGYRDIMARSRHRRITAARQHAIELVATKYPHLSLPRLGEIFSLDHTTIMHALWQRGVPLRGRNYYKNLADKRDTGETTGENTGEANNELFSDETNPTGAQDNGNSENND